MKAIRHLLLLALAVQGSFVSFAQQVWVPEGSFAQDIALTGRVLAAQPDGKVIVSSYESEELQRFNMDGTQDAGFQSSRLAPSTPGSYVFVSAAVNTDGAIVIVGQFSAVNGMPRPGLAKLSPTGELDQSFDPQVAGISAETHLQAAALYTDGRVVVGGWFDEAGMAESFVHRLKADGSLDNTFHTWTDPNTDPNNSISVLALQSDGKVLIGGRNWSAETSWLVRLAPDGSLDSEFHTSSIRWNVMCMAQLPDGRIMVGGQLTGGVISVFESSGQLSTNSRVVLPLAEVGTGKPPAATSITPLPDGSCVVSGWGFLNDPSRGLVRLRPLTTTLHVFGDSWSATTGGPFWQGRWSNGSMWPEFLSARLGIAFVASNNLAAGYATLVDVVTTQIPRMAALPSPNNDTCVIWAGGNDVFNAGLSSTTLASDQHWATLTANMLANTTNSINVLYAKNARVIVVADLDDLSACPGVSLGAADVSRLRVRTAAYNDALHQALNVVDAQYPDLRLHRFNFHDRWDAFLPQCSRYGFTKWKPGATQDGELADKSYAGPGKDYVFWDGFHPTSRMHELWAVWFEETLHAQHLERLEFWVGGKGMHLGATKMLISQGYRLQRSSNLRDWLDIDVFSGRSQSDVFIGNPSERPTTFYRLRGSE